MCVIVGSIIVFAIIIFYIISLFVYVVQNKDHYYNDTDQ